MDFSTPLFAPKFSPPTSFTSFLVHSIFRVRENSRAWVAQNFEETWDPRLEEGGELNIEGMWRGKNKRSASSQMKKRKQVSSLLSLHFFFLYGFFFFVFFFLFFCLRRRKCQGERAWKKWAKTGGKKWEPKVKMHSGSLKESSLPSLHFFPFLWFILLLLEKKNMPRKIVWNRRVEVRGQK